MPPVLLPTFNFLRLPPGVPVPAVTSCGVMSELGFEPQRGGQKDCVIASLATAANVAYEEAARLLGVSLNDKGLPDVGNGLDLLLPLFALHRLGWSATLLVGEDHPSVTEKGDHVPTSDQLKHAIQGRRALRAASIKSATAQTLSVKPSAIAGVIRKASCVRQRL